MTYRGFEASFIPEDIFAIARKRLRELGGLALIVLTAIIATSLATWSVNDPSFSHATSAPVRNLLGTGGAVTADLLMQLIGVASIALIAPIAAWGWRLTTHHALTHEIVRVMLWLAGAPLAAGFASCLPRSAGWPLPSGLGGVVGDAILRMPVALTGPLAGTNRMIVAGILGMLAFAVLAVASGFFFNTEEEAEAPVKRRKKAAAVEEEEEEVPEETRASVSLGWLMHGFMSFKARVGRLFGPRAVPAKKAVVPLRRGPRIEPKFNDNAGQDPGMYESQDEYEEEVGEEEAEAPAPRAARAAPKAKPASRKGGFVLPPLNLLTMPKASVTKLSEEQLQENAAALEHVLSDFGVRGEIVNARPGPVVTLYELEPAPGIKSSRVIGLADDIARSMSALAARVAVVQGRNAIGIELPNPTREKVLLREILNAVDEHGANCKLPLCLGKNIGGESIIVDLARMPHLLIAGTTGSGKSVAINTMILSLVFRLRPDQCRLIMVDPKMLELSVYDGIPHLLTPVVTDPKKAVVALKWAVREMEERYKKMSKLGVRNIAGYNARLAEAKAKGEKLTRTVHTGFDKDTGKAIYEEEELELEPLPFIVVIVDEMADLMMVAGKEIEGTVQRLAQMARAAGLHVILATQRPSVDVITGTIKANFPTRISFQVTSKIDSRTILGEQGAEQLLGQGDMLHMAGGGRISRVHGPFVSDEEVEKVVRHLKAQGTPQYLEAVTAEEETGEDGAVFDGTAMGADGQGDLFHQAVAIVKRDRKASTSYIQRRLQIGYNRAASIMERMELEGIVGQSNHAGKREILVDEEDVGRF